MNTKIVGTVQISDHKGPGDSSFKASGDFTKQLTMALTDGTGDDKAQFVFPDDRSLEADTSEELDLYNSLKDSFGQTLSFSKIKAIFISASESNEANLVVGGAAANAFTGPFEDSTDKINVQPGGLALLAAPKTGWTVTEATGDLLKIAAGTGGADYTIIIVGEGSAA